MYTITEEFSSTYFFTSSGVVRKIWSNLATFLRFCFSLMGLNYNLV